RSDEPYNLLDLVDERGWRVSKQQMRFVEEKHERRLVGISHFGQPLEQLRQHPQQEIRVQLGRAVQLFRREHVDDAPAASSCLQQVVDIEHRLAEERVSALLLDLHEGTLNRSDRSSRDVAVLSRELLAVVSDKLQHGPQIFQIKQQQARIVCNLEHKR